jgi:hypothetical protein
MSGIKRRKETRKHWPLYADGGTMNFTCLNPSAVLGEIMEKE